MFFVTPSEARRDSITRVQKTDKRTSVASPSPPPSHVQPCQTGARGPATPPRRELVRLIDDSTISVKIAKHLFPELLENGGSPKELIDQRGLKQVTDTKGSRLRSTRSLADNPDSIAKYKAGKTNIVGFLVGQVMKATRGKANPKVISELLTKKLS